MLDHNPPAARSSDVEVDAILEYLTNRQHIHPQRALNQVLEQAIERFGCCPQAVGRALEWLKIDATTSIGRLRRGQLIQLARAIHRLWSQAEASAGFR